jgi:hypothetical protein
VSKFIGLGGLVIATASFAFAGGTVAPEIDGASAVAAVALLSGGLLVLRARRGK